MTEFEPGFHVALGMASQKDYFSLTCEMLRLLGSFPFVTSAVLYEVQENAKPYADSQPTFSYRRFLDDLADRNLPRDLRGFDTCALKRAPVEIHLDSLLTRLIFFIKGKTGPKRLVSVDGESFSPRSCVVDERRFVLRISGSVAR